MWSRIAEEMAIPWRAAEAMHWQMGEQDMARRAGVTPFSLTSAATATTHPQPRSHMRQNSVSRLRRSSNPNPISHQLPSLAELTAGMPAFTFQPTSSPYTSNQNPNRSSPPQTFYQPYQQNGRSPY